MKIYELHITANVTNRFVHTLFTSRVKNRGEEAREASFSVILPDTAYISGFTLEIDEKKYEAYVQEKEVAKHIYDQVCPIIILTYVLCFYNVFIILT